MEIFFPLSEQLTTQNDPSFCGLASLSMALNALRVDPRRVWKGVWRWFDDSMLDCCLALEVVQRSGIVLHTLACLARCNGAAVRLVQATDISEDDFRGEVKRVCAFKSSSSSSSSSGGVLIASYSRKALNQTGDGHFSPIGGYSPANDMVLIMDVARFKYPPHWVPLPALFQAMQRIDPATQRARGFLLLTPEREDSPRGCSACLEDLLHSESVMGENDCQPLPPSVEISGNACKHCSVGCGTSR